MNSKSKFASIGEVLSKDQLRTIRGGTGDERYDPGVPDENGCALNARCSVFDGSHTYYGYCSPVPWTGCSGVCLCATTYGCYTPTGGVSKCVVN